MSNRKLTSEVTLRARTPADPLSRESLIAWLETMPPEQTYCYNDVGGCLLHQYFTACGLRPKRIGGTSWSNRLGQEFSLSDEFRAVANDEGYPLLFELGGNTFGKALERARALSGRVES